MQRQDYLKNLADGIGKTHHVEVSHCETVPVIDEFKGKIFWEGNVEVFDIIRPTNARQVYAWGHPNEFDPSKLEITAVLGIAPIDSPAKAVRASVAQEIKRVQAN